MTTGPSFAGFWYMDPSTEGIQDTTIFRSLQYLEAEDRSARMLLIPERPHNNHGYAKKAFPSAKKEGSSFPVVDYWTWVL